MKSNQLAFLTLAALVATALASVVRAADPWADRVVSYMPGDGVTNDFVTGEPFSNPLSVLGAPTRLTSPDSFPGIVTPLQSPFRANELASIGYGGALVVAFDEPVVDDPLNPYGIDLLVFGNAFFVGNFFNPDFSFNAAGLATDVAHEGGVIEVSADGVNFFAVPGEADGLFPTNAYLDLADPFPATPGALPTNFTRPVDPAFNPFGKTYAEILAGYGSSGGGLGVDIGPTGLSSISFVRITNPLAAGPIPEIDALADVRALPEPGAGALATLALIFLGKTVRGSKVKRDG